jgi:hypothetical protein
VTNCVKQCHLHQTKHVLQRHHASLAPVNTTVATPLLANHQRRQAVVHASTHLPRYSTNVSLALFPSTPSAMLAAAAMQAGYSRHSTMKQQLPYGHQQNWCLCASLKYHTWSLSTYSSSSSSASRASTNNSSSSRSAGSRV